MIRIILTIGVVIILTVTSCSEIQSNQNKTAEPNPEQKQNMESSIVKDSVINEEGKILYLTFNNAKRMATLILGDDTINLRQDTMGSGIKYSNDHYEFIEWHGNGELKKDSIIIFKYNN